MTARIRPVEALETALELGKAGSDWALFWFFAGMVAIYCPRGEQMSLTGCARKIPKPDTETAIQILQSLNPAILKDRRGIKITRAKPPKRDAADNRPLSWNQGGARKPNGQF
jgi:hypothetical protein